MPTNTENRGMTKFHALSSDLSRSVGQRGLLKLVLDAVLTLDVAHLQDARRKSPDVSPQMLLTLLTYCYSTSIYGSRDIEWAVEHDQMVRYICARDFPEWQSLRRFRRQHRKLVHQCMVYVMKQVWALKFDEGEADYVGYEWFESELLDLVNTAATERIDLAALTDGVESE